MPDRSSEPLAGRTPLVDVHAHFYHPDSGRGDWERVNAARLRAGEQIGIRAHIASILGSWGHTSPTYFPSPHDLTEGNDAMLALQDAHPDRIRCYVSVNPNDTTHAREEIERCVGRGAVGLDRDVVSVEFKINFLRPAVADRLRCRGHVLRAGKMLVICEAEVFALKEQEEKLVSKATVTLAVKRGS